ncbi:MAG: metal-sensitive transcriptional regulator, partial [Candidatus Gracilibacteria bacterium]|nr:metal-sensitive transcriptional regulator [Candidatus Gracilibacteria bacterium]
MNEHKKKALISIKKAKTSLQKIEKLIEDNEYCGDIMIQNMAVIGLIKSTLLT